MLAAWLRHSQATIPDCERLPHFSPRSVRALRWHSPECAADRTILDQATITAFVPGGSIPESPVHGQATIAR